MSDDKLISNMLLWTPSHGRAKAGQPTRTYIRQLCADTGCSLEDLLGAMDDRDRWWERVREICAGSTTWWWWWWVMDDRDGWWERVREICAGSTTWWWWWVMDDRDGSWKRESRNSTLSVWIDDDSDDYIILYILVRWLTVVKGDSKASFSVTTTPRCWGEYYSFPWIAPLVLDSYLIMLNVK